MNDIKEFVEALNATVRYGRYDDLQYYFHTDAVQAFYENLIAFETGTDLEVVRKSLPPCRVKQSFALRRRILAYQKKPELMLSGF